MNNTVSNSYNTQVDSPQQDFTLALTEFMKLIFSLQK